MNVVEKHKDRVEVAIRYRCDLIDGIAGARDVVGEYAMLESESALYR